MATDNTATDNTTSLPGMAVGAKISSSYHQEKKESQNSATVKGLKLQQSFFKTLAKS